MDKPTYGQYIVPSSDQLVNFGVGQPCNDELPLDIIKKACNNISEINDYSLLQYGDIPGYHGFRKELSNFLSRRYGQTVSENDLFVTNGVTGAIALICSLYKNKIKKVYAEEPTYFLMINIFKEFGLEIETVSLEQDGINVDELEEKLKQDENETKMLYTIPAFHNPTSISMSHKKKQRISELSHKYNMIILADEVYQLLYFDEENKPSLPMHYYYGKTYSISSFSKILAPSLRLGWIQASTQLLKPLKECGQLDSSGGINPFVSRIVHNVIRDGDMDTYLDRVRSTLKRRCDVLANSLKLFDFVKPNGGYFIWIKLPFDSLDFLDYCTKNKVKFHTGNKFSSNGSLREYIRLSFSFYDYEGLETGANRLTECYKNYMYDKMNVVNVSIHGATGRLGSKISSHIQNRKNSDGTCNITYNLYNKIERDLDIKLSGINDVIVDVTRPEALEQLLFRLIQGSYRVPLLIGTTGDLPYDLIKDYSKNAPVAVISNFSYGVPSLLNILEKFDIDNWKISIEEIHHVHKLDKPSGTAKSIAGALNYNGDINSIREGEEFGTHIVRLENNNEILEFKHKAKTRDIFASGSLRFMKWIIGQPNGVYHSMTKQDIDYFELWSGCGNTFGIIDDKYLNNNRITEYCDYFKVDGIITYKIFDHNKYPDVLYDFMWTYYNRDGSCVEMCGNGARCVAKCLSNKLKRNHLYFKNNFEIGMNAEVVGKRVKVEMPKWENYNGHGDGYFVKVGVPHVIVNLNYEEFNDEFYADLTVLYEEANKMSQEKFGTTCNVSITSMKDNKVLIRTYERGVEKETGACGTACCAAHFMYQQDGKSTYVTSSGEELTVEYKNDQLWLESDVDRFYFE